MRFSTLVQVRKIVAKTFATLISLMPLESGVPDPEAMSEALKEQKRTQRSFLEQLLDPSKLEHFTIPVPIKAELRSYQQAGIDWMNFLRKYKLHGILCDDMGLGKTLQVRVIMKKAGRRLWDVTCCFAFCLLFPLLFFLSLSLIPLCFNPLFPFFLSFFLSEHLHDCRRPS